MKKSNEFYRFTLSMAQIDPAGVVFDIAPQTCIEESDKSLQDRTHLVDTCIGWKRCDPNDPDNVIQRGRITHIGRVTVFDNPKSPQSTQTVQPFGGSWDSLAETLFQRQVWFGDFSTGELMK